MLASLLRLFALRPFLTMAILGIPIFILIAIGLSVVLLFKFVVFVVLPVMLVLWVLRKLFGAKQSSA